MLGCATQGAIIRSCFQSAELMDAPSKFFFSLEKKNGQKKFIHALQSEEGDLLTNPYRKRAVHIYKELYKSDISEEQDGILIFFLNLPQITKNANEEISKTLSLVELGNALKKWKMEKHQVLMALQLNFIKLFG